MTPEQLAVFYARPPEAVLADPSAASAHEALLDALERGVLRAAQRDAQGAWQLKRMTNDTKAPRSVRLSADEKTLYVADGDVERGDICTLRAYPINADGRDRKSTRLNSSHRT